MKRILSCLLVALLLLPCIPMSASAAAMSWEDIRPYINSDEMGDLFSLNLDFKYDSTKSYQRKIQFLFISFGGLKWEDLPLNLTDGQFYNYDGNFIDYSNTDVRELMDKCGSKREVSDYSYADRINDQLIEAFQIDLTFENEISRQELVSFAHKVILDRDCWYDVLGLWPTPIPISQLNDCVVYASLVEDGPILPHEPPETDPSETNPPYLSTVDWNYVIDKKIFADVDRSKLPVDYKFTVDAFPELELNYVNEDEYRICFGLKNGGKENMINAYEKLLKHSELTRVRFDFSVKPCDPADPPSRYDFGHFNWDRVIDKVICLDPDKSKVPANYKWTVDDFPELELDGVRDNGDYIVLKLKNGGKENMIAAYEKMLKRSEFLSVEFLTFIVINDPPPEYNFDYVDWAHTRDKVIRVECIKTIVPADYEWTIADFPELDLDSVVKDGDYLYITLKNGGKENMIDAFLKMTERAEFYFDVNFVEDLEGVDPVEKTETPPATDPAPTDTAVPTDTADETTAAPEANANRAPQTGDAVAFIACMFVVDSLIAAAIIIYRKRRRA